MTIENSKEQHVCPNCMGFITHKGGDIYICPKHICPVVFLRKKDGAIRIGMVVIDEK